MIRNAPRQRAQRLQQVDEQAAAFSDRWGRFTPRVQDILKLLLTRYGPEAAGLATDALEQLGTEEDES